MERDANYGLIGGLTLALLAAAFGFILWLGQSQFARDFDEYRIIFDGPVRGLSEGGEVQFNGIPVGEITRISLDPRNPNRVLAGVRLREDTPVRVDSTAATESQGITGGSYIQISAGTPSKPLLKEVSKEALPVIKAEKKFATIPDGWRWRIVGGCFAGPGKGQPDLVRREYRKCFGCYCECNSYHGGIAI